MSGAGLTSDGWERVVQFNNAEEFAVFIVSEEGAVLADLKEKIPLFVNFATLHSAMAAKRPCGCGGVPQDEAVKKRLDRFNYMYEKFLNDLNEEQKEVLKNTIKKYKNTNKILFKLEEKTILEF